MITRTLANFPIVNQLSEPTMDGQLDENARNNCVVGSIAAGLQYHTGQTFDGDEIKDAVYGQGFTGPMSASHFVGYCSSKGVNLFAVNADQAGLVAAIHADIAAGSPCLVTMPSQWGTAPADPTNPAGSTHVGIACGDGAGEIRVMNPWGGFWQDQPDAWWQARLCYGQVWTLQKAGTQMALVRNADGSATDPSNGLSVGGGIAGYIWAHNLESAGLGTGEVPFINGGQHQVACALSNGVVVRWYGNGADENGAAVMTGLMGSIATVQAQRDAISGQLATSEAHLSTAQALVTSQQQQIKSLQDQLAAATQSGTATALVAALKAALA